MLAQRLRNGALLVAALAAAVLWARGVAALAVMLLVTIIAQREFYCLLDAASLPNFKVFGTSAGAALVAATWLGYHRPGPDGPEALFTHALFVVFFIIFARQFHQKHNPRPLETMAGTLMGILYVAMPMSFFVRLLLAWGTQPDGRVLVLFMVVVVKACDTGAYFTGMVFGRHKLMPRISPAKSWEGCAGGLVAAVAAAVAFAWVAARMSAGPFEIPLSHAAVLGIGLGAAGILGDLAESLLKRAAGVKDAGALLPGLGGLLDVIDSLLPAAPLLYLYLRYAFPVAVGDASLAGGAWLWF